MIVVGDYLFVYIFIYFYDEDINWFTILLEQRLEFFSWIALIIYLLCHRRWMMLLSAWNEPVTIIQANDRLDAAILSVPVCGEDC